MSDVAPEQRLSRLEQEHAATAARLTILEDQQRSTWIEIRRISREGRDELAGLREELKHDRKEHRDGIESLLTAINTNKIAWSMMSGGAKAAAWVIGTLIGLAGLLFAGATAVKRLFLDG